MQLDQLEEFWESEVPRVGEAGSRGWAAWTASGRKGKASLQTASTIEVITQLDPYKQWAARESQMACAHCLPSRSADDTDDPYSTILFSDLRPFLIHLESVQAKNAFRRAWLSLLGLYVPGFPSSLSTPNQINWDDRWNLGHLTRRSYLDALFPKNGGHDRLTTEAVAGVIVGREKEYVSGFGPVKCWGYGVFGPLETFGIEKLEKGKTGIWGGVDMEDLDETLVRRVFGQLRLGPDDADWDVLTLAFEVALSVKG